MLGTQLEWFIKENPNLTWMIWGYPYFRKLKNILYTTLTLKAMPKSASRMSYSPDFPGVPLLLCVYIYKSCISWCYIQDVYSQVFFIQDVINHVYFVLIAETIHKISIKPKQSNLFPTFPWEFFATFIPQEFPWPSLVLFDG